MDWWVLPFLRIALKDGKAYFYIQRKGLESPQENKKFINE